MGQGEAVVVDAAAGVNAQQAGQLAERMGQAENAGQAGRGGTGKGGRRSCVSFLSSAMLGFSLHNLDMLQMRILGRICMLQLDS